MGIDLNSVWNFVNPSLKEVIGMTEIKRYLNYLGIEKSVDQLSKILLDKLDP